MISEKPAMADPNTIAQLKHDMIINVQKLNDFINSNQLRLPAQDDDPVDRQYIGELRDNAVAAFQEAMENVGELEQQYISLNSTLDERSNQFYSSQNNRFTVA